MFTNSVVCGLIWPKLKYIKAHEDIMHCSSYCKSMGANDPRSVANLDHKGMIGRIYVGYH